MESSSAAAVSPHELERARELIVSSKQDIIFTETAYVNNLSESVHYATAQNSTETPIYAFINTILVFSSLVRSQPTSRAVEFTTLAVCPQLALQTLNLSVKLAPSTWARISKKGDTCIPDFSRLRLRILDSARSLIPDEHRESPAAVSHHYFHPLDIIDIWEIKALIIPWKYRRSTLDFKPDGLWETEEMGTIAWHKLVTSYQQLCEQAEVVLHGNPDMDSVHGFLICGIYFSHFIFDRSNVGAPWTKVTPIERDENISADQYEVDVAAAAIKAIDDYSFPQVVVLNQLITSRVMQDDRAYGESGSTGCSEGPELKYTLSPIFKRSINRTSGHVGQAQPSWLDHLVSDSFEILMIQ
ncbi:uncharacterized protein BXZ73DRAFT_80973 [Epithele typhae]|uniref:uncharacterized protein n=1 Tax=Epithele typhae TaxID=378194 RepID=UPI00200862A9|nr:uncharacterized protein BXZ73DRAFT_80973 [Epithele typhae]KAH9916721.1 hypothetical protein BXZ73DRAFT_80973 [Epithele typhae]